VGLFSSLAPLVKGLGPNAFVTSAFFAPCLFRGSFAGGITIKTWLNACFATALHSAGVRAVLDGWLSVAKDFEQNFVRCIGIFHCLGAGFAKNHFFATVACLTVAIVRAAA
jgi:hypothetical protein